MVARCTCHPGLAFFPQSDASLLAYEFHFDCLASEIWSCVLFALFCAPLLVSTYNLLAFLHVLLLLWLLFSFTLFLYYFAFVLRIWYLGSEFPISHFDLWVAPSFSASRGSVNINIHLWVINIVAYRPVLKRWLCKQWPLLGNASSMHAIIKELCFL
jgi:hypothetical protein